ncbi:MAG TPA: PASTA domain-containing protein [Clostridia bacterium]|nr:PASTA domain-containing protein [Clostridia bacterium]
MLQNISGIPDVSGYRLAKAKDLLASLGYTRVDVQLTASPRTREAGYGENSRVVRQSISSDDTIVLLVCN